MGSSFTRNRTHLKRDFKEPFMCKKEIDYDDASSESESRNIIATDNTTVEHQKPTEELNNELKEDRITFAKSLTI